MNKTLKYVLIAVLVISLAIAAYIIIAFPSNPKVAQLPADENQVADLPVGSVQEPVMIDTPEFMTAEEKTSLDIDPGMKIQVLDRDTDGNVSAYKIINSDEDIQSFFYEPMNN